MVLLASAWIGTATTAHAGSGPWVIGEGQGTLYVGVESQRLTKLAVVVDGERDVVDVGEGLSSFVAKAIGTVGLTPRFEVQATLPYWRVQANRGDSPLCAQLGADLGREACETTSTLGVVEVRGKGLLVDEFFGAPLSLAVGAELRAGDFALATRERLTNVGESAFDVGGFLTLGRTGAIGSRGYWSGYLELLGRYRFPVARDFPPRLGDRAVPGSEFAVGGEWIVAPSGRVAFGPAATLLWRPFGVDWGDADLTDQDRLASLRVFNARAGVTAAFRGPRNLVASVSVLQTVYAVNNPTNVLSVSAGLQALFGRTRRSDSDD